MNNPVYEAQLNRHEEKISEISGRLHSYDLGLKWCEEQIKKLAGDDYSCCVHITEDARYNELSKEYDKLKSDYNTLKEAFYKLEHVSKTDKENFKEAYSTVRDKADNQSKEINSLLKSKELLKKEIEDLETKLTAMRDEKEYWRAVYEKYKSNSSEYIKKWKNAFLKSQVDVNNFQGAYSDAKKENDRLTECLSKYAWRRISTLYPPDLEDHELYLFVIDGYSTPVKGRYHDDSPSHISLIVDDGDGKGPQYKVHFFMDGVIRYWMPLPEMPDTVIK